MYSKNSTFTDFRRFQVSLIPYVFKKSFHLTSIRRQISTEVFGEQKNNFFRKSKLFFSELHREKLWTFRVEFSAGLSRMQPRSPNEHFVEK